MEVFKVVFVQVYTMEPTAKLVFFLFDLFVFLELQVMKIYLNLTFKVIF